MAEGNNKITITERSNNAPQTKPDTPAPVDRRQQLAELEKARSGSLSNVDKVRSASEVDAASHSRAGADNQLDNVRSGASEVNIKSVRTGAGRIKVENLGSSTASISRMAVTSMLLSGDSEAAMGMSFARSAFDFGMTGVELLKKRTANTLANDAKSIVGGRDGLGLRTASKTDLEKINFVSKKHGIDLQFRTAFSDRDIERINAACERSGVEKIKFREMSKRDVRSFINGEGGRYLKDNGIIKSTAGGGFKQHHRSVIPGIKARDKLSAFDAKLLAAYKRQGLADGMGAKKGRFRHRRMLNTLLRQLKKCEGGQGLSLTITSVRYLKNLTKMGKRSLASGLRSARNAAKLAYIAAEKLAIAAKADQLALLIQGRSRAKAAKAEAKLAKKVMRRERSLRGRFRSLRGKVKDKLLSPFKKFYKKLKNRLLKTRLGKLGQSVFGRFKFLHRLMARIRAIIVSIFAFLGSVISIILGAILLCVLVSMLVSIFVSQFASTESASSGSNQTMTEAALEVIAEKHVKFMTEDVQSCYTQYNGTVTISEEDVKDEEVYENLNIDEDINETTNAAEIISMAMVHFDFDMETADETSVMAYVKRLYNASHELVVNTTERQVPTGTDDEGNTTYTTVTDADIVVTTYYFDEIFSRDLSATTVTTVTNANEATRALIEFMRSKGLDNLHIAAVLGVYTGEESHFDPTSIETFYFEEPFKIGPLKQKVINADFAPSSGRVAGYGARYPAIKRLGIGFGAWTDTYPNSKGYCANNNTDLRNYAKSKGKEWYDMGVQLEFWWEGKSSSWTGLSKNSHFAQFKNATSLDQACYYFFGYWVKGHLAPVPSVRMNAARKYLDRLNEGKMDNLNN